MIAASSSANSVDDFSGLGIPKSRAAVVIRSILPGNPPSYRLEAKSASAQRNG
jgi:hypothetical protein